MKILFLVPYPRGRAPSQRFRFEQYFNALSNLASFDVESFLDEPGWQAIYLPGNLKKIGAIARGFWRRLLLMRKVSGYDLVFIHREASPLGPPVFEWMIARVFGKPIVYDFDDAIWSTDRNSEGVIAMIFRWRRKVRYICRIANTVSCGNDYLADFARKYNPTVILNPTTIDTIHHRARSVPRQNGVTIGWTGTHTTLKYLDDLLPVIRAIEQKFPFVTFVVIANRDPGLPLTSYRFLHWSLSTEIDDLMLLDIGVMPLPDNEWSKGKCGFKALQFMSLGIPTVASPVGVNTIIVRDGINGYL